MPENIYINTVSKHNFTEEDDNKMHVIKRRSGRGIIVLSVVLFSSLLANAVLAYMYHTTNTNQVMKCEPVTNCSNPAKVVNKPSPCCLDKDLPGQLVLNKERIYVFQDDIMTWSESRARCQTRKGDLVIINSYEEQDFLAQQIVKFNALMLHWIGLTDSQTEGVWLWVDKTPLNNNISWWIYPPDDMDVSDPSGEDCAVLNGFLKGEKWGDISCLKKERSICEIPCS